MSVTSMSDKFFILSCDGGGIRGLASAVILEELEKRLKARHSGRLLHKYLSLVSGTSTGSIIACGISSGISTDKIKELYLNKGIDIFPEFLMVIKRFSRLRRMLRMQNPSQPIYQDNYDNNRGINSVLKDVLGVDNKFGALNIPTLVTSYDTLNQHFVTFNSTQDEYADINTWEVARASSAAPIAFPAYLLSNEKFIQFWEEDSKETFCDDEGKKCIPLVDGGLAANNPAMCAIAEQVRKGSELSKIVMISVGTGHNPQHTPKNKKSIKSSSKQLNFNDARNWGALQWFNFKRDIPILRALFDGSADVAEFQVKQILDDSNYFRFQPEFSEEYQSFNANKDKLQQIVKDTEKYLALPEIQEKMDRLVSLLSKCALTPSM